VGYRVSARGTVTGRAIIAPVAVAASSRKAPAKHVEYGLVVALITVCCLAVEIMAPPEWQPNIFWLLSAPAAALFVTGIPALLVARRSRRAEETARERDHLIGLLLKDYAGERSDWLWCSDVEGRLRGVSQKFALHAGRTAGSLEGTPLSDLLGARGKEPHDIAIVMRQRQPFHNLEARIMAGSSECTWRMAGAPMFRDGRFDGYVGTAANVTSESRARDAMSYLAYNDGLTGLANRVQFQKRLAESVARLDRYGTAFTLLLLDLDKFKAVNDTLGHQAGDRLLIEVAKRLNAQVRKADLVARLGGDEFALLLPNTSDPGNVANLATRLIHQLCQPFTIGGKELSIGVSIGIAIGPANGTQAEQLVRNADLALYRAKAEGGDSYCFFEERMDAEAHQQNELETELEEALERDELVFHYHPLIAAADGKVAGMEALIRWNHPTRGLMQPVDFVPIAERTGLIDRIGEWKIFEACRALSRLPDHVSVAVNVSARHFRSANVAMVVEQALTAANVAAHRLEIEVTESLFLENPGDAAGADSLAALKKLGVTIVLDHFGTGYSSLSGLRKFAFDKLKIDRSLVAAASKEGEARETVKAIMALAQALAIPVACEGVETSAQAEFLGKLGSKVLQGDFLAKPLPFDEAAAFSAANRPAATSTSDERSVEAVG
jgi:diguanylate cyclase (GGDEF)-like protein